MFKATNTNSKNILFSKKNDWIPTIVKSIKKKKYTISFGSLHEMKDLEKYDLIIPLTNHDQMFLNKAPNDKNFFCASNQIIQLANDKHLFNQYLRENGFDKYLPEIPEPGQFPYILKKRKTEFGAGCYIIASEDDETNLDELIHNESDYFKQELISGREEYTTHIFFKKHVRFDCTYKFYFRTNTFIKGTLQKEKKRKKVKTPYINLWTSILTKLNYEGLCCFNYKIVDNKPIIFEMNPRFGASLARQANEIIEVQLNCLLDEKLQKT